MMMSHFPDSNNETGVQKFSVDSDEVNKAQYSGQVQSSPSSSSSSFIVDIESYRTRLSEKEQSKTPASRIIRNFSRKGSIRGVDNLANLSQNSIESPRGSPPSNSKTPIALVAVENHVGSDHHHHVTITATDPEAAARLHPRRLSSGIRRSKPAFSIDPRKVLFVFATLSSLGSLILIYFTLAIKKMNEDSAGAFTWQ